MTGVTITLGILGSHRIPYTTLQVHECYDSPALYSDEQYAIHTRIFRPFRFSNFFKRNTRFFRGQTRPTYSRPQGKRLRIVVLCWVRNT